MLKKIINILYKYEGLIGIFGFLSTFIAMLFLFKYLSPGVFIPVGIISWLSAFFIGDSLNRHFKKGSIFPHRKNQANKMRNLITASLIMNLFSDATGAFFARLWYYPRFNFNFLIYVFLAPLGYIMFGFILYVFYRFFKKEFDGNVKPGRMSNAQSLIYKIIINSELVFGIFGLIFSLANYFSFYSRFNVEWYEVYKNISASINIWYFIILWISTFFIMEFICHKLQRETLTRDIIRGDLVPLMSIIFSSLICIIIVEFVNAPFQVWVFSHWPMDNVRFLNIPVVAYLLWPMQYLILIPLVRIFDGKNIENVW